MSAITTNPIVPANESNIFNQYSPAPVQNINPTKKQNKHTVAILRDAIRSQIDKFINMKNLKQIISPPVTYCFLKRLHMSISNNVQSIPSSRPICEPRPKDNSMVKKSTAQKGAPGSETIACVKTINANPVPSAASLN